MCAICGKVGFPSLANERATLELVRDMLQALRHRGPDSLGELATPAAVLGATRLAIRGVHDGRQPMVDPASGVVAVCNGEIDNHRELRTWLAGRGRPVTQDTDVAVIPGLYAELGEAFVSRLIGEMASPSLQTRRIWTAPWKLDLQSLIATWRKVMYRLLSTPVA